MTLFNQPAGKTASPAEREFWKIIPRIKEIPLGEVIKFQPGNLSLCVFGFMNPEDRAYGWWRRENKLVIYFTPPRSDEDRKYFIPFPVAIIPGIVIGIISNWFGEDDTLPERPNEDAFRVFTVHLHRELGEGDIHDRPERLAIVTQAGWCNGAGGVI